MPADRLPDLLRAAGLFTPDQLREVDRPDPHQGGDLATDLLRRGWLTPLQLRWLLRGAGRRLALGPYLLLDRLGGGGMGQVFKARHRRLGRLAALKVVRPDRAARPRYAARFRREAEALARLDHPNVVHAYDAGDSGGAFYLALEYVDGPDLSRILRERGPLPAAEACEYGRQAALGLEHLHARGVVHRDVKPSNLALAEGGVVKVLDVGLARLDAPAGGGSALTRAGRLLGSPDYLAPEQVADPRRVDGRADLYGLGCTLYRLLTGEVPFPGGPWLRRALRHLAEEPRPLAELRPGLPPEVTAVVGRLMAKRREDRYPTADEAAAALAVAGTAAACELPAKV